MCFVISKFRTKVQQFVHICKRARIFRKKKNLFLAYVKKKQYFCNRKMI